MKTIGSVLKRLLLALGGSAPDTYYNDITLVDKIADLAENGQIPSSVIDLQLPDDLVLITATAFAIPSPGSSVSYDMDGLTANHVLVSWNFSSSAENNPPADLLCTTYDGYFTIVNNGGTTAESIQPIFVIPTAVVITNH